MAIPDYQTCMPPLLKFVSDGLEHSVKEVYEALAKNFELTDSEKSELLPSGKQSMLIAWHALYGGST